MEIVEFFIIAMATWRLTSLLVNEDGPFQIFIIIRMLFGVKYFNGVKGLGFKETLEISKQFDLPSKGKNEIAKVLLCVWCASIWIGAAIVVLNFTLTGRALEIYEIFLYCLAISGMTIKIDKI